MDLGAARGRRGRETGCWAGWGKRYPIMSALLVLNTGGGESVNVWLPGSRFIL